MLDTIKIKIRALVKDFMKSDVETFEYLTSLIFTLAESNIVNITAVLRNGIALGSGDYNFDSTTNKITISVSLTSDDIIEVDYTYQKYSDTELDSYITSALVWMSIYAYVEGDYELEDEEIIPTPANKTVDLISIIASILIQPDYIQYSLPNLTVRYLRTMTKEEKIEKIVNRFSRGLGASDVLEWY